MYNTKKNIYSSANSRDYYQGKSFEFAGDWKENVHYLCDDYKVSFVTADGILLACTKSHKSNEENKPKIHYNEETHIPELNSNEWTIAIYGCSGINIKSISYDEPDLIITFYTGDIERVNLRTDKKADKVIGATNGNLAKLDSNGNLEDSGKKISDFSIATNLENGSGTNSLQMKGSLANGTKSFAEGIETIANNNYEHSEGAYNISIDGLSQHTVGIGTSSQRKNAHLITTDGKHYIPGVGNYDGTEDNLSGKEDLATVIKSNSNLINITYSELVTLKSQNKLIPGTQYRITDYVTLIDSNISALQSANHYFDIIVTADSTNTLSEDAKACIHSGDSYFANNNLSAWKIKYSIFNDKNKFNWADANGKGVIYYMKDEFDNEAWFDFKNIQIKGSLNGGTEKFYYVFSKEVSSNIVDGSLDGTARSNIIGPSYADTIPSTPTGTPTFTNERDINYCIFYGASYNNVVGSNSSIFSEDNFDKINWFINSYNNILGNYCRGNKLNYTFGNTLLDDCYKNEISFSYDNHLSKGCHHITINYGWNNNFEDGVHTIIITGTSTKPSYGNEFKKNCRTHTLGNDARYNIFGEGTEGNTLGNVCHGNRFEQYANNNTLANSCSYNVFNEQCSNNTLPTYTRYLHLEGNNNYLVITKSSGTYLWYINVEKGLSNKSISITAESNYNNCNQRFIIKDGSSYKIIGMSDIVNCGWFDINITKDSYSNNWNCSESKSNIINAFNLGKHFRLKYIYDDPLYDYLFITSYGINDDGNIVISFIYYDSVQYLEVIY